MEGESAVGALFAAQLDRLKAEGKQPDEELKRRMDDVRADYEHQLDARFAGARGFIDAVVYPEDTRDVLHIALTAALQNHGPHLGPFVLPAHFDEA
jgi:3-methylcrotonyl-CoA carboxylase beta subunit